MEDRSAHIRVKLVDKVAGVLFYFPGAISDFDLAPIRNAQELVIMGINESNALPCPVRMGKEKLLPIPVDIEIVGL